MPINNSDQLCRSKLGRTDVTTHIQMTCQSTETGPKFTYYPPQLKVFNRDEHTHLTLCMVQM